MNHDLKMIKKKYGENMMRLCRSLFPTILEEPGLLYKIMSEHFSRSKRLYYDIIEGKQEEDFEAYVNSYFNRSVKYVVKDKTAKELLDEAGYILYECNSEEDIQRFTKYYAKDEELCTFWGGRLTTKKVFFAVRKDVDEIRREDFPYPMREDRYGTSVLSIQFARKSYNNVFIYNRYNHHTIDPDATFGNNLERIIPGLTEAFRRDYDLNGISGIRHFEMPDYVSFNDKFYRYNYEIDDVYYCVNNVVIDKKNKTITRYDRDDKSRYIVFDYFILDLKEKKFLEPSCKSAELFIKTIPKIDRIDIVKDRENKTKKIIINRVIEIELDDLNRMIGYRNPIVRELPDDFMNRCDYITTLDLPNVVKIGNHILMYNESLRRLFMDNLEEAGNDVLIMNVDLKTVYVPNLRRAGDYFISSAKFKKDKLVMYRLESAGKRFFSRADIEELYAPSLVKCGEGCLEKSSLFTIYAPKLEEMGLKTFDSSILLQEHKGEDLRTLFKQEEEQQRLVLKKDE